MSIGETFEDLVFHGLARFPRAGEELRTPSFSRTLGGGTFITAVAAARLGLRVAVMSALPEGATGRLASEGIMAHDLRRRSEPHAVSAALSTDRDRAFVTFDGVNAHLESRLLAALARRLPRARHVHFALGPRKPAAWAGLVRRLQARGSSTSWDFGWHEDLPGRRGFHGLLGALDWVLVNEAEATLYARTRTLAAATKAWSRLARHVVIKRGARGAIALVAGAPAVRAGALRVRVVDTTGAGDAFNGGFLAALLKGASLPDCLRTGVTVGSLSTRAAGGFDALPTAREMAAISRMPSAVPVGGSAGRKRAR